MPGRSMYRGQKTTWEGQFFPPCAIRGSNLGGEAWWQAPTPAGLSLTVLLNRSATGFVALTARFLVMR